MTNRKKELDGLGISGKADTQARTRDGLYYNEDGVSVTQSMCH